MKDKNKIGTIEVSRAFVEDQRYNQGMKALMRHFIPVHIDYLGWKDVFAYTGYSDWFEEIDLGHQPIKYFVEIKKDEYGNVLFEGFKKMLI